MLTTLSSSYPTTRRGTTWPIELRYEPDIEAGLADSAAGWTRPVADALREFGFTA
jgi:hypothetical protein